MKVKDVIDTLSRLNAESEIWDISFDKRFECCDKCDDYRYDDYRDDCMYIEDCDKCKHSKERKNLYVFLEEDVEIDENGSESITYDKAHMVTTIS